MQTVAVAYNLTKAAQEKIKVALIENDIISQKLLAAWSALPIEVLNEESENIWETCVFSYDAWISLTGLPFTTLALEKAEMLVENNLVFPDGRIHYWIEKFLSKKFFFLLPSKKFKRNYVAKDSM